MRQEATGIGKFKQIGFQVTAKCYSMLTNGCRKDSVAFKHYSTRCDKKLKAYAFRFLFNSHTFPPPNHQFHPQHTVTMSPPLRRSLTDFIAPPKLEDHFSVAFPLGLKDIGHLTNTGASASVDALSIRHRRTNERCFHYD